MTLSKIKLSAVILMGLIIPLGTPQTFAWIVLSNFCHQIGNQHLYISALASSLCAGIGALVCAAFLLTKERCWSPIVTLTFCACMVLFTVASVLPMLLAHSEYTLDRLLQLIYAANVTSISLFAGDVVQFIRHQNSMPQSQGYIIPGLHRKPDAAHLDELAAFVSIQVKLCASNTALIAVLLILVYRLLARQLLVTRWRQQQEQQERWLAQQQHEELYHLVPI